MSSLPVKPRGLALLFAWSRVRFTLIVGAVFGFFLALPNESPMLIVIARTVIVGLAAMFAFGLFEQWPRRLPVWLARSVLQLLGIVAAIPVAAAMAYIVTTGGNPEFEKDRKRVIGYASLTFTGVLFAPWIAVGAMLKQRDAFAREQALGFELERSEFERQALDARLRLLQAQVEPHFLFNTLANVQALVDAGSPQASKVLASLIAYLRAAVPRMHETATTLGQETDLVRAYLELMEMRMPDRLQVGLHIDPAARKLQCPPMTLLTLVENAVRHGIDPSEVGGRIDVDVWIRDGRVLARVTDTGAGMKATSAGLGTGLSTLRERLQLAFGAEAQLRLSEIEPHGVCAELEFPARQVAA
ncbi:signal transduction histidine kinase [Povalibacter uvarum]|uniref:Signal transduction histidine kinase n=1 Tax=Povalibacter uvarum TaxID=732238 RepID=A0A841HKJ3_9GAMM|nr:histidine kinase [Povalibacter uvarum]MBB6092820.1 signal transduction histidine kinase [Povalibacter uvarum]